MDQGAHPRSVGPTSVATGQPPTPDTSAGSGSPGTAFSLDHAIWFEAPRLGGRRQLDDVRADGLPPPRGPAIGHVFDEDGGHVATVTQEVLLRRTRPEVAAPDR